MQHRTRTRPGEGSSPSLGALPRDWRLALLVATGVAAVALAWAMPRIPQPQGYLDFADRRTLLGVRNAADVLSNVPFALVGAAGLLVLRRRLPWRDPRERTPWIVFFLGVVATSAGSAWFHLDPRNETLVWDRLPMAIGFMALFSALLAERVSAAAAARLLWPLALAGVGSVFWWFTSERAGDGDLRPYLLVQYYPLLAIPLVLALFPRRFTLDGAWLGALGAYLLAKVAEIGDREVFAVGGIVSGHTLKHLFAAGGIGVLAWMLARRRPLVGQGQASADPPGPQ